MSENDSCGEAERSSSQIKGVSDEKLGFREEQPSTFIQVGFAIIFGVFVISLLLMASF